MRVARVANLENTIDELKDKGFWIYGADMDGEDYKHVNTDGKVALVIGSEGNGLGKLIRSKYDVIISLPMKGKMSSLNASVSAGILMYHIYNMHFPL
jgi:23S rRNA (guanosine2251-2'-O)-methyltransferase